MRHLPDAFNMCGLEEYAMKLLTEKGFPSYRNWLELGATTLWEKWFSDNSFGSNSRNHHMYSHFMAWLIETVLGIHHDKTTADVSEFILSPYYFEHLSFARGSYLTDNGHLSVDWKRCGNGITLNVTVDGNISVSYKGQTLTAGTYQFKITPECSVS